MILNEIKEEKIETQNLFFIDTISKYIGKNELTQSDSIIYIDTDDMLGAKVYTLSKNKTVTLKKTDEYSNYIYVFHLVN